MLRFTLVAGFALVAFFSTSASAATFYSYVGKEFTTVTDSTPPLGATFSTGDFVAVSLEFASPLSPNLVDSDVTALLLSFTAQAGTLELTDANAVLVEDLTVTTDGAGEIVGWVFNTFQPPPYVVGQEYGQILTSSGTQDLALLRNCQTLFDSSCISSDDRGNVLFDPGTWSLVPEPSTALLLATGLVGLAAQGRKRRLH